MMPFIVISYSEAHGQIVEEYETRAEAERWAHTFTTEGETASVFMKLNEILAVDYPPEDFGVHPGIDYPATLCPAF